MDVGTPKKRFRANHHFFPFCCSSTTDRIFFLAEKIHLAFIIIIIRPELFSGRQMRMPGCARFFVPMNLAFGFAFMILFSHRDDPLTQKKSKQLVTCFKATTPTFTRLCWTRMTRCGGS
jgi:hypothetical protein